MQRFMIRAGLMLLALLVLIQFYLPMHPEAKLTAAQLTSAFEAMFGKRDRSPGARPRQRRRRLKPTPAPGSGGSAPTTGG